ncbi:uncharacterized protein LOC141619642 [Silene latifolia]|uniref:uncharacterized protein LOC141619642 n=1 Tax=Silene latifolia TaxID=37657 RepID=UPI003D76F185
MKLNPSKCTFGVSSGKFLAYIVTQRGIDASTEQIKAVLQVESTEKPKDVQRLAGKGAEAQSQHPTATVETRARIAIAHIPSRHRGSRDKDVEVWRMHIDGASNQRGAGVGLILRSPHGDLIAQAVRCEFKATNNETEYEALILGPRLALDMEIRNLQVYSDSLLIVNHVNDEYIARDSKMIAYLKVAMELKQKYKDYKLKQVPRDQNVEADSLTTLRANFKPTELANIHIAHVLEP